MMTMMLGRGLAARRAPVESAAAAPPKKSRRVIGMIFSMMAVMPQREFTLAPQAGLPPETLRRLADLETALGSAIRGKPEVVRLSVVCLLARGHLLIEDVPGVGKTTLAQALARSVSCRFHRLQFTSDMLPSDVLGVTVYNAHEESFEFKPGPIFSNFLLADEINRTTPKTQSALLEAMNEGQVTIDGHSHSLPRPFMVIATQNPVEHHGEEDGGGGHGAGGRGRGAVAGRGAAHRGGRVDCRLHAGDRRTDAQSR